MPRSHKTPFRRWIAAVSAFTFALAPLGQGAFGAAPPTALSDVPIAAKVAAKPNIIYTLDDSGSMTLSHVPDYVIARAGFCRNSTGTGVAACTANFVWGYQEPMFAADFNRMAYNPNVSYDPPVDGAGNQASWANPNGAPAASTYKMMTTGNTAAWTAVKSDPYLSVATGNLAALVDTYVFCNTDWPKTAYATASLTSPTPWAEVGDTSYGEHSATAGQDCRINGTAYDAINGAPAIVDDYN